MISAYFVLYGGERYAKRLFKYEDEATEFFDLEIDDDKGVPRWHKFKLKQCNNGHASYREYRDPLIFGDFVESA